MDAGKFVFGSYCSSTAWGGRESSIVNFHRWMNDLGWKTILYAKPKSMLYINGRKAGLNCRPVKSFHKYGNPISAWRLARACKKDKISVLILHQSFDILVSILAMKLARYSFKITFLQHMHIGDKTDFLHSWEYRHFSAWVTPANYLAERAFERTSLTRDKIYVIPQGIELDRFIANRLPKTTARQKLNLPGEANIIGIIGRLDPNKGQDVVIKALAHLHKDKIKPHLLILGDTTKDDKSAYEKELHGLAESNRLSDYVHFRPYLEKPEYAYAAMDIFVMASNAETYGLVTIEAMASGLPVIGTNSGGTREIISHEKNGLLFEPRNDTQLAAQLRRYLDNPEFSQNMAVEARREAEKKYSHLRQCQKWEQVFKKLSV
jgi:glycosyltransferase involved in cell wall biosynthesis